MKVPLACAASVLLAGCIGPNPNLGIADVGSMPAPMVRQAWSVTVSDAVPPGATVTGAMEGTSCKNKAWDPPASEARALEQLQIKAREMNATGLASVSYTKGGFSMATNCWESVTATATAYR